MLRVLLESFSLFHTLTLPPGLFLLVEELWGSGAEGLCQAAVHFINRMYCTQVKLWPRALPDCWKNELVSQPSGITKQILLVCLGPDHIPAFQAKIAWSHQKACRNVSMGRLSEGYLSLVWGKLHIHVKGEAWYVRVLFCLWSSFSSSFSTVKQRWNLQQIVNTWSACIPMYVCVCIWKSTSPCLFLLPSVLFWNKVPWHFSKTALLPNHGALIYAGQKSIWID